MTEHFLDGIAIGKLFAKRLKGALMWTWRNALGYVSVGFAVWLISYVVEWNIRYGGQQSMGDALLHWWGDVVLLQWVDTTLGAGLLAALAGGTALAAVLMQRQFDRQRVIDERIASAAVTVGMINEALSTLIDYTQSIFDSTRAEPARARNLPAIEKSIDELTQMLPKAYEFGFEFGVWWGNVISELRMHWDAYSATKLPIHLFRMLATLWANRAVVRDPRDLFGSDGYYRRFIAALNADEILAMDALGIDVSAIRSARRYVRRP